MEGTAANFLNRTTVYVYHTQFSLRLKVIVSIMIHSLKNKNGLLIVAMWKCVQVVS